MFGPLRDAFNAEQGWSGPDDPARARAQQPGHRAYVEVARLRGGLALEPAPRDLIRDYPLERVEHGTEPGRCRRRLGGGGPGGAAPGQELPDGAGIPRPGDRWRLRGELYAHDFQRERLDRAVPAPAGGRPPADRGDGRARARAAWRELERRRKGRAAFHRGRYGGGDHTGERPAEARVAPAPAGRPEPFSRYQRRQLGDDALVVEEHRTPDRDLGDGERANRAGARDPGRNRRYLGTLVPRRLRPVARGRGGSGLPLEAQVGLGDGLGMDDSGSPPAPSSCYCTCSPFRAR